MTNFSHGFKCFHGRLPVPPHGWPLLTGSGIVREEGIALCLGEDRLGDGVRDGLRLQHRCG